MSPQQKYEEEYSSYKEITIENRRYKHGDIQNLILELKDHKDFEVELAGKSLEDKEIYYVKWGEGPIDILLWTQMHGNEPTATMALFDFINYLKDMSFDKDFKKRLAKNCSIHMIPLLNPDGADRYWRYTALGIDMNRDAIRLNHPESRILKEIRDRTDAEWGFNLHDQSIYYSAGRSDNSARFSFLAPAYDWEKNINSKREDAMQMIGMINEYLQKNIPGHVGKFDDTFEPRAFGDNIQKWGTRTILIESGGTKDDPEKIGNRRLHYNLYRLIFESILNGSYENYSQEDYEKIPFNNRRMYDLMIQHLQIEQFGHKMDIDIGFKRQEVNEAHGAFSFYHKVYIDEIGDLSTRTAYEIFDASEYEVDTEVEIKILDSLVELEDEDQIKRYLSEGYAVFQLEQRPPRSEWTNAPYYLITSQERFKNDPIKISQNPFFYLTKDGERKYLVVNGQLIPL